MEPWPGLEAAIKVVQSVMSIVPIAEQAVDIADTKLLEGERLTQFAEARGFHLSWHCHRLVLNQSGPELFL